MNDIILPIKCSTLARFSRLLEVLLYIECAIIMVVGIPFAYSLAVIDPGDSLDIPSQLYFGIWLIGTGVTILVTGSIAYDNFPRIRCIGEDR